MATSISFTNPASRTSAGTRRRPLVLWHLLSLDGPSVAALWTWFLARANRVPLAASSLDAMFLAVWLLYAADRLLDTRESAPRSLHRQHELEERHRFHRFHRRAFSAGIILASVALAALLPRLPASSLRLYAMLGALVFAYFVLVHTTTVTRSIGFGKEIAVGVFFSAATFIPTVADQPRLRLILLPAAVLFAVLCCLNCLLIRAWEHSTHRAGVAGSRPLAVLTVITVLGGTSLALCDRAVPWQVSLACALAAALMFLLHTSRHRLARLTLRAAADLCLLTPLLLAFFLPPFLSK